MEYKQPAHYTKDELRAFRIRDMKTEIRCAMRDGLYNYAAECRIKLKEMQAE